MFNIGLFEEKVQKAETILVTAHSFPDADAVCSAQIVRAIIKRQFDKDCDVSISGKVGRLLMPFYRNVVAPADLAPKYDLVICLDTATKKRLGDVEKSVSASDFVINIDHHATNERFGNYNYVESDASSVCEIVYRLANQEYPNSITPQMAQYAYAGIITDTNALMANNIQPKTYNLIAEIIKECLSVDVIKNYFFKSYSKAKLQLLGKALNSISFHAKNKIAFISISKQDMDECGATFDDTLGMVDYALNCYLVEVAIAIIEQEENKFYVSLRGKQTNVSEIAQVFGGGGHSKVSAFQYCGKLEDFFDKLLDECVRRLSTKQNNTEE